MKHTGLCVAVSVWSAMPASAEPLSVASPPPAVHAEGFSHPIDLSAPFRGEIRPHETDDHALVSYEDGDRDGSTARPGFSLGPLRAGVGTMGIKRAHLATFRVDGVTIFGANIGGSVDGRSAHIVLSWPSGP